MATLSKEEALTLIKKACEYSKAKKRKTAAMRKQVVKAAMTVLVKQGSLEKRAFWGRLLVSIIPWLLKKTGSIGARLGLKGLKNLPKAVRYGIGRPLHWAGRGVGKATGGRLFSGLAGAGTEAAKRQAYRMGGRGVKRIGMAGTASMFMPDTWFGGEEYPEAGEGYAMPDVSAAQQAWSDRQQAALDKGYVLAPNPFLDYQAGVPQIGVPLTREQASQQFGM